MRLPFRLAGALGHVAVAVAVNTSPETLGCRPAARGFPYCSASISHPARGYAAALGWIQLVRSTDGCSGGKTFEMDPFEPLGRVAHPFAFFGFLPSLFDVPSRDPIREMDWIANSFLCDLGEHERHARALLGFSWGFTIRDGKIATWGPNALGSRDWDAHRALLTREYPNWSFAARFHDA